MSETNLIVFSSAHHLIHAEYKLKRNKIPITLLPSPSEFETSCLTAITFPPQFTKEVETTLDKNGIEIKGIYSLDSERLLRTEELIKKGLNRKSEGKAFLDRVLLRKVELCIADPHKIRIFADFSDDVGEILPYLNATLPTATFNQNDPALTFMRGPTLITIYPQKIAAAKVEHENAAVLLLEWIRSLINDTFEKKDSLDPSYQQTVRLNPIELYKYLPRSNCQVCGELTCLAFAVNVLSGEKIITNCSPLLESEFKENKDALFQLLQAMGFKVAN